jgi:hypothetical protein
MKKTKILFEGHDLKFLSHVINHFSAKKDCDVEVYTYSGHLLSNSERIWKVLAGFDIIFCEWGLGNLQWFSHHKLPGQKLVTRIHLQEFFTDYLSETNWENVDKMIFVGPFMMEKFVRMFPGYREKCIVIPNLIDTVSFDLPKEKDSVFNLGLLGILPKRKSPHIGLEILRELRKEDNRYKLFIKSRRPDEVDWLWRKPEEQEYYNAFYDKIIKMGLQDAVVFEPHGSDVQEWFQHIGFILSPSEFESFHMAIAECMASGGIPVIRNWEGSHELFPDTYSFNSIGEATEMILKFSNQQEFEKEAAVARKYCQDHFDVSVLLPEYDKILKPEFYMAEFRKEFQNVWESRSKLLDDLLVCDQAREKSAGDLAALVVQQQGLTDNNSTLTLEISQIRSELVKQGETNQLLAGGFDQLQQQYSSISDALNHRLLDISRISAELQNQTIQNTTYREEIIRLQQVNEGYKDDLVRADNETRHMKETLSEENTRIQKTLENEKTVLKETLEKEKNLIKETLENEKNLIIETLNKENALIKETMGNENTRIARDFAVMKAENAALFAKYEQERARLQDRIDHMKNINTDLEKRLVQTFSSLSWKVGAILIKKPSDLVIDIKRKLLPRK